MSFPGVSQVSYGADAVSNYNKFGRNYILSLQVGLAPITTNITITYPYTIEFDIDRDLYSKVNRGTIRLYNLAKETRNQLIHDQWDSAVGSSQTISVVLQAGYDYGKPQTNYPIILKGTCTRAFSYRQGVNFITQLDVFDGGTAFTSATSNWVFGPNTPTLSIYNSLISDLAPYGVSQGALSTALFTDSNGDLTQTTKKQAWTGNTVELLVQLSNGLFFIDNLAANVLVSTDAIGGTNVTINSSSGLLGTPIKESQWLLVDLLFEPRVAIGTVVQLETITGLPYFNGPHRVAAVSHKGMISAAVCGEVVTSLGLQTGVFNTIGPNSLLG